MMEHGQETARRDRSAGMTLLEVMIGISLLTILLGGLIGGIVMGNAVAYSTTLHQTAFSQCRSRYEAMRGTNFLAVTETNFPASTVSLGRLGGRGTLGVTGRLTNSIVQLADPVRKNIHIEVEWDYRGRTATQSLHAVLYQKQL